MTHYCCAGNQPRFKARIDDKTGDLIFDFAGGAISTWPRTSTSTRAAFTSWTRTHLSSEWVYYVGGKKGGAHALKLKRKP